MQHDEATATKLLDELELRLSRPAAACLGVKDDAPIGVVSEAFMSLAQEAHPRWFSGTTADTKRRARRCYRDLREAYWTLLAKRCDGDWSPTTTTSSDAVRESVREALARDADSITRPAAPFVILRPRCKLAGQVARVFVEPVVIARSARR